MLTLESTPTCMYLKDQNQLILNSASSQLINSQALNLGVLCLINEDNLYCTIFIRSICKPPIQ